MNFWLSDENPSSETSTERFISRVGKWVFHLHLTAATRHRSTAAASGETRDKLHYLYRFASTLTTDKFLTEVLYQIPHIK